MSLTLFEYMSAGNSRHGYTRHDGQFGIEIETETNSPYRDPSLKFWNVVPDGSLRNFGREYVLSSPMSFGKGLEEALAEFGELNKTTPFNQGSNSTSVHVHINMLNETVRTLFNTLTTYALLEPLLISACGEERKSNLFCLPFHDTGATVSSVQALFSAAADGSLSRHIRSMSSDMLKYSGMNIAPLRNLGSIEVRTMEGTTDVERITTWTKNFESILNYCRNDTKNPIEVLSDYLSNKDGFLESLGIPVNQFNGDISSLLKKGEAVSYDFAATYYDWEKVFKSFDAVSKKSSKSKAKELDAALDGIRRRTIRSAEIILDDPSSDDIESAVRTINETSPQAQPWPTGGTTDGVRTGRARRAPPPEGGNVEAQPTPFGENSTDGFTVNGFTVEELIFEDDE